MERRPLRRPWRAGPGGSFLASGPGFHVGRIASAARHPAPPRAPFPEVVAAASAPEHASAVTEAGPPLPSFLVLYDGVCGLCSRTVSWLLERDERHALAFAPLQGETAARLRAIHPEIPDGLDSVVYVEPGGLHLRSKAFLHLSRHLGAPWRWAYRLRWLPAWPLDVAYRLVARIRYRVWGRAESCRLPDGAGAGRLLP
jgi:predicted DCC family thiol-disulfide oxidoreductase YuxK